MDRFFDSGYLSASYAIRFPSTAMIDRLKSHYDRFGAPAAGHDFLTQVGHTLHGKPISYEQFQFMVQHVCTLLDLGSQDRVLDLCCGNGIITQHIAAVARSVVGVDFSQSLIDVARTHHQMENTSYQVCDALALDRLELSDADKFDKVLMHGSLQHFQQNQFLELLHGIRGVTIKRPLIVMSYIPDIAKRGLFYNTPRRRLNFFLARLRRLDRFGTWWSKDQIFAACARLELEAAFLPVDERLEVARYRFSAKIS